MSNKKLCEIVFELAGCSFLYVYLLYTYYSSYVHASTAAHCMRLSPIKFALKRLDKKSVNKYEIRASMSYFEKEKSQQTNQY